MYLRAKRKGIDFPVLDHCEHKIPLNHFNAFTVFFFFTYLVMGGLFHDAFSISVRIYSVE